MSTIMSLDRERVRLEPASVFSMPMEVVDEIGLTRGEKLATLQRWADGLHSQLRATSEGMPSPPGMSARDVALLDEIAMAQKVLNEQEASVDRGGT